MTPPSLACGAGMAFQALSRDLPLKTLLDGGGGGGGGGSGSGDDVGDIEDAASHLTAAGCLLAAFIIHYVRAVCVRHGMLLHKSCSSDLPSLPAVRRGGRHLDDPAHLEAAAEDGGGSGCAARGVGVEVGPPPPPLRGLPDQGEGRGAPALRPRQPVRGVSLQDGGREVPDLQGHALQSCQTVRSMTAEWGGM